MPALQAGVAALASTQFPERDAAIKSLDEANKKNTAMHAAYSHRQASSRKRRDPRVLQPDYFKTTGDTLALLETISSQLSRALKLGRRVHRPTHGAEATGLVCAQFRRRCVRSDFERSERMVPPDMLSRYLSHNAKLKSCGSRSRISPPDCLFRRRSTMPFARRSRGFSPTTTPISG